MQRTCSVYTYATSHVEGNKRHSVEVCCDKDYRPWCLAVTNSSVFFQREENFIFTPVLSSGLKIERIHVSITAHKTTSLAFRFQVFTFFHLQKRQVSLWSVLFHLDTLIHVWIQNLLKLEEGGRTKSFTHLILMLRTLKSAFDSCNLLPTVQNWPNLFWEATFRPFSRVVILVSYFSWASTEAKTGLGIPGRGVEREMFGYPPPLLYFL